MAKKTDAAAAASTGQVDVKQLVADITAGVREELGISAPNSVRASGAVRAGVSSEEDLQNFAGSYDSRKTGPKAQAAEYQKRLDAALAAGQK